MLTKKSVHILVPFLSNQQVCDDLNFCVLLFEVSTLPSLVTISLIKLAIYIFEIIMWPDIGI